MSKAYPVGLVGEANFQASIRRCRPGQRVQIMHEPDNPYYHEALAVATDNGETIGYIARDCWLQEAIHDEGRGCEAHILDITATGPGGRGVVLEVTLQGRGVSTRTYRRPEPEAASQAKSWLARLLGF